MSKSTPTIRVASETDLPALRALFEAGMQEGEVRFNGHRR